MKLAKSKSANFSSALAAAAVAAAAILASSPIAAAEEGGVTNAALGSQAKLDNNNVVQGWTVTDLKPSTDTIPYDVRGTLWEITATSEALEGSVTPIVSNFNTRAADGENYRALFQVATPQGVNPSTITQGEKASGKVYFDVTGAEPDVVVYNSGGRDLLLWDAPPPSAATAVPVSSGQQADPAPAAAPVAATPAVPAATPAVPAAPAATPAGAGSRASDLPAATPSAPAPAAGTEAAPVPAAGAEAAPVPAVGTEAAPVPAAGAEAAPVPASNGAPLPAGPAGAGNAAAAVAPSEVPVGNPAPAERALVPAAPQPTTTAPVAPISSHGPAQ